MHFVGTMAQKERPVEIIKHYEIDIDSPQYRQLIDICMKYAGVDYGIWQVLGIALTNMFGLKKNPLSVGDYSQVCSELVGIFLRDVMGFDIDFDLDTAGPKEIDEFLYRLCKKGSVRYRITPR